MCWSSLQKYGKYMCDTLKLNHFMVQCIIQYNIIQSNKWAPLLQNMPAIQNTCNSNVMHLHYDIMHVQMILYTCRITKHACNIIKYTLNMTR